MHKMLKQDAFVIPAMGSLTLKPGSYHIMLIGVQDPRPKAGDVIPVRLDFADGKQMTVQVPVKKRADMMQRMENMQKISHSSCTRGSVWASVCCTTNYKKYTLSSTRHRYKSTSNKVCLSFSRHNFTRGLYGS
jgi:hypothetical protein